jgi:hypothetical protein
MKRILEGRWDCSQCGSTRILGRHKSCPQCGDPRNPIDDPSEEPYLPSDSDDITGTDLAAELGEGADWICDHCGQANHSDATSCRGCGQAHDEPDRSVQQRVWSGIRNVIPKPVTERVNRIISTPVTARSTRGVAIGGTALAVVLALVWGIWSMFFTTHEVELTVTETHWSRGVEVEEFRTLQRDDFDPPSDARIHRSYQAIHHYRQVLDHYRTEFYTVQVPYTSTQTDTQCSTSSNGNGTFTQSCYPVTRTVTNYRSESRTRQVPVYRDEPVYGTKYEYEIDRWVTDYFHTVDDSDAKSPFWPERIPGANEPKHRVGDERRQNYTVVLTNKDKTKTYKQTPDFPIWRTVEVGEIITANINRQGKIRSMEWSEVA